MESSFLPMARPGGAAFTGHMTEPTHYSPDPDQVAKAIAKRSFCMLATVSPRGRPHAAGVLYQAIGTTLNLNMSRDSRKGRNIVQNPHVAVTIPIRDPLHAGGTVELEDQATGATR